MTGKMKDILYASSVLVVLAACLSYGQAQSPFRFLYFPLIVLLALRTNMHTLLNAGFTFSILFALMAFSRKPPDHEIPGLVAEVLSFFLATIATGFLARDIAAEREKSARATATIKGISDELKQKSLELQTALEALSKTHLRLQGMNRFKSRFLANVSHELRTPLTSIRSYSEILLDYNDIDDVTRREFLKTINDESERMTILVNKNLDLLRMEAGKSEADYVSLDPRLLVEVSMKVVAPMAQKKSLPLIIDIPVDFPPVKGDQHQLTQVLVNLLNNAVKFTVTGKITAGARRKEDMAEFFVADTGEGIFEEEKEVIFDEFYRISENVPDRPSGSGLGLAIAREIVEEHGGRIWVDSAPGKGSTFYFTVPIFAEEKAYAPTEPLDEKGEALLQYEPILVQSESVVIRQTLRKLLENLGYKTIGADTAKRGKDISVEIKPGLIISDNLEESDDFTRMGNWAREAGVKIVLVTLYVNPATGELDMAANGYFRKPFDRFQIASIVEPFVRQSGRFFIISPIRDEARQLQVLLGAEGYTADLFIDETEALNAASGSRPDGVIIGSFPKSRIEDVITSMKKEPHCNALPLFLLLDEGCRRFAAALTLDSASRRTSGKLLAPLIATIEKSYAGVR